MFCYGLLLSSRLQVMSSLLIKKREDEAIKGLLRVDYSKPNLFKRRNSKKAALTCKGSLTEYWLSICTQTCTEYLTNGRSSRPHQISTTPRLATPLPSQESSSALVHMSLLLHKIRGPWPSSLSTSSTCSLFLTGNFCSC